MARTIRFADPIPLPGGRSLKSVADVRAHIASLPKATQRRPEWLRAAEYLAKVEAKAIPEMLARGAVYRAVYPEQKSPAAPPPPRASKDELFRQRRRAFVAKRDAARNAKKPRPTR